MPYQKLLTAGEFKGRYVSRSLAVSLVTLIFISGYLASLLDLSALEWGWFGKLLLLLFPALFVVTQVLNSKLLAPILAYLTKAEHSDPGPEALRAAFRGVSHLPLSMFSSGLVWWTLGGGLVATGMWLRFREIPAYALIIMCLAATSGGFIASTFHYFINKEMCRELLGALAARMPDRNERREHTASVTLRQKLMVSITGVCLVIVVFAMFLSLVRSGRPIEVNVTRIQSAFLEESIESMALGEMLDWREAAGRARRLQIAEEMVVLDAANGRVLEGDPLLLSEVEKAYVAARPTGDSTELDSNNAMAWKRIPGEDVIVVAVSRWESVRGDRAELWSVFLAVALVSAGIAFALAYCLSRDVGTRTLELKEAAERLAEGDLRDVALPEAEDELGELARAFEAMAGALREAVGGVAEAANFVESTASEIVSITSKVAENADAQSKGVQEAATTMEGINAQLGGISSSAGELNMLVEESSSSILEMGAAGDELNDTASVLSSRVEEVSTSIEQMVRSVKEVNSHTGLLTDAANDTSSSMEEMASAMRQIDTIGAEAAQLSQAVVDAAEGGQSTVQQTIEGMESIRQATATAQRVISGLGSRAKEIGSILDVIDDVADETNLLALNAAIIAAQAGEQGRAFSVVADEIKELADRVLSSTKEIGELIRAVQDESDNAVDAIADGAKSVAAGVERSQQAGSALEEITRASHDSGQRILEIVRSMQEQSRAATHVVEMMERVNTGVEAIHRATEEQDRGNEVVYRSTVAMREVAQQLSATTEEQARGGARIRQSIDGVRDATESINASLQSQSGATQEVVSFLEEVSSGSHANDVSSDRLAEAARVLMRQAEVLREGVRRFVIDT
ncbi:MAG: methyl-accepting chemotaxis protein [Deltaproteobacteria bacterium]|nr:methyl-accepting chemotaxis protein [Deltaproteobacteria bacterium]